MYLFLAALGPRRCAGLLVVSDGYSSLRCAGLSLRWPLLLRSMGPRCAGLSSCGLLALERHLSSWWHTGSRAQAQQSWPSGLVAPRHVGSSPTRARTHVPCTGRQTPNHCTTREARFNFFVLIY